MCALSRAGRWDGMVWLGKRGPLGYPGLSDVVAVFMFFPFVNFPFALCDPTNYAIRG